MRRHDPARPPLKPAPTAPSITVVFRRSGIAHGRAEVATRTRQFLERALRALGYPAGEVVVAYVSRPEIRRLKAQFLGIDQETDILSFPDSEPPPPPTAAPIRLGELALCLPFIADEARRRRIELHKEHRLLLAHGLLHLLGHDHDTRARKARMWAAQRRLTRLADDRPPPAPKR